MQDIRCLASRVARNEKEILSDWITQMAAATRRIDLMKAGEIQVQCSEFLRLMNKALAVGGLDFQSPAWDKVRDMLGSISRSRAQQGFSPSETATFVFSVKRPLFSQLRRSYKDDPQALAAETWSTTELFDEMGLFTLEVYQKSREDIIKRQQEELLELSTRERSLRRCCIR